VIGDPFRAGLIWASHSAWLEERLTRAQFMRRAVRAVMPGSTIDDALDAAFDLQVLGIRTMYARLDPPATDLDGARAQAGRYLELLERLATTDIDGEVSVRPAELGLALDPDVCLGHLRTLAASAAEQGSFLWLDMDDAAHVDRTLELYQRLRATHLNTGVTIQASLRRSATDVERLLPLAPAIRLVKGSTLETKAVAFRTRKEVDANYLGLAVILLRESRNRPGMRIALGSHDVSLVDQISAHASAAGIAKDAFEVQMRYGVRVREQHRLARTGHQVLTLIPYGTDWYPWYMRRLAERPAGVLGTLRHLLPI
jgi:proline dehydrogenase